MVVSLTVLYLLVVSINLLAEGLGSTEVKGCTCYLENLSCWDACLVDGQIEIGIDFAQLVLYSRCGVGNTGK